MQMTADPYKNPTKNVRGGRSWVIPTDHGLLPAKEVAQLIGITPAAIHARLWKWLRGTWTRDEILGPPDTRSVATRERKAAAAIDDPESACEIPVEEWGSLAFLNGRRAPRERRLRAILVGSWESRRGCRV